MNTQKTAVELVDELINMMGCPTPSQLRKLKCAIEREQGYYDKKIYEMEEIVIRQSATIKDMNARLQSAITMRPISDLPDKVPDGCVIVCVNGEVITGTWYYMLDMLKLSPSDSTHFCIIPLPKRKLKPCPWCKAIPVERQNYWIIEHADECVLEATTIIRKGKEDLWGRE